MEVVFRCKQSGNTVKFSNDEDIRTMRMETHYEEVKPEKAIPIESIDAVVERLIPVKEHKKRGRPAKG